MHESAPPPDLPESIARGHEARDVQVRPVLVFLAILVGTILVSGAFLLWLIGYFERTADYEDTALPPAAEARPAAPPEPRLQALPKIELRELQAKHSAELRRSGWVDREQGIAQIPIERAIEIVAESGLPQWPAAQQQQQPKKQQRDGPPSDDAQPAETNGETNDPDRTDSSNAKAQP